MSYSILTNLFNGFKFFKDTFSNSEMQVDFIILFIVMGIITVVYIIEKSKSNRIDKFKKMSIKKIKAIGNYEKNSKTKYFKHLPWNKNLKT